MQETLEVPSEKVCVGDIIIGYRFKSSTRVVEAYKSKQHPIIRITELKAYVSVLPENKEEHIATMIKGYFWTVLRNKVANLAEVEGIIQATTDNKIPGKWSPEQRETWSSALRVKVKASADEHKRKDKYQVLCDVQDLE